MGLLRLPATSSGLGGGSTWTCGGGSRTWTFEASSMHGVGQHCSVGCFPFGDRRVLCTDQCGRAVLFDAGTRQVRTMPALLREFKDTPVSLFVPSADGGAGGGGSLFLLGNPARQQPGSSVGQPCDDFEVLVYREDDGLACYSQLLPPPPYVHDPSYSFQTFRFKISSYALIDGGICISVNGLGTYRLDTASHTWSRVGEWMLPFHVRVEHVPELGLWFGLAADTRHLAAADLSAMDAQLPQLIAAWEELDPGEGWKERQDAQLVHLGAGRFCTARHFQLMDPRVYELPCPVNLQLPLYGHSFSVFTGVEVVPRFHYDDSGNGGNSSCHGKVKLEMICHKSKCYVPDDEVSQIEDIF